MKVKAVIFDMDGTLVDSMKSIFIIFNHIMRELGLRELHRDQMIKIAGRRFSEILYHIAPALSPQKVSDSELKFLDLYKKKQHQLFPGVLKVLDWLKSEEVPMGIFTTAPRNIVEDLINQLGISDYFDVIISNDDVVNPKPHPEGVMKAAQELHVKTSECVVIGDGPNDIQAGKAANAMTVGVLTGYCSKEVFKKEHADLILNTLNEIPKSILNNVSS